jgi:hypothetical protein
LATKQTLLEKDIEDSPSSEIPKSVPQRYLNFAIDSGVKLSVRVVKYKKNYFVVIINICPYNPPRAYGLNCAATNSHGFSILGFVPLCSSGNFEARFGCYGITLKMKGPRSSKM